jgi:hypothetical protein
VFRFEEVEDNVLLRGNVTDYLVVGGKFELAWILGRRREGSGMALVWSGLVSFFTFKLRVEGYMYEP